VTAEKRSFFRTEKRGAGALETGSAVPAISVPPDPRSRSMCRDRGGCRGVKTRARRVAKGLLVSLLTTGVLLVALEFSWRQFAVHSDGWGFTLSSQTWFQRHWKPINSAGYRDREHPPGSFAGKKVIFVVGDSFVAGHGVESVSDRFADRLREKLGAGSEVVVIAQNGWDTEQERAAIAAHHARPDVVVLSYFVNDIDAAAARHGRARAPIEPPTGALGALVGSSYFANDLYWRGYRFASPALAESSLAFLEGCYADDAIWKDHERAIEGVAQDVRGRGARLVVVVFPALFALERTRPITAKVAKAFAARGASVLDLGEKLAGRDPRALVVGSADAHPNGALHGEVADLLFPLVTAR
jgi:GDSL-like Lipase/Acylhydrolase family